MRRWFFTCSALLFTAHAYAQPGRPPQGTEPPPAPPAYPAYPQYPGQPAYPPPQGYPGVYPYPYYTPPPPAPPRVLHYEEGQPIPRGYYLDEGMRRGPVIAGIIVLAVPYALGFAVTTAVEYQDSTAWLLIPVAGPWLMLAFRDDVCEKDALYCDDDRVIRTMLVFDGLAQGTGAALLFWGITSKTKRLVREDIALRVLPRRVGSGYGLGVAGSF